MSFGSNSKSSHEPRYGNDPRREQELAARVRLALVVLEEHARRTVQLRDDHALGAVDDERAVVGHQGHLAHVDLLLLDLLDRLGLRRLAVVDDHLQLRAHGGGVGQAALLALPRVERGLGHVEFDELHLDEPLCETIGNAERNAACRPFGLALLRRDVLLQEGDVRVLLHGQQIGHVENALALAEALADALLLGVGIGDCLLRHEHSVQEYSRCDRGPLPKATVFRALRSKLGGRPLPAAGGQPRRCTGARPNPFLAVGSRNFFRNHLEKPSILGSRRFQVLSKGHPAPSAKRERPGAENRRPAPA